jgi:hypothetical protein
VPRLSVAAFPISQDIEQDLRGRAPATASTHRAGDPLCGRSALFEGLRAITSNMGRDKMPDMIAQPSFSRHA